MPIVFQLNKNELNAFLGAQPRSEFLQSWQWGEFQRQLGHQVVRLGLKMQGRLKLAATLVEKKLFGRLGYFYSPRGPVAAAGIGPEEIKPAMDFFANHLKSLVQKRQIVFWRLEPLFPLLPGRALKKTLPVQPVKTLVLDLSPSEQNLLAAMHAKTRYNIRLAVRHGVKIREGQPDEFNQFWRLLTATSARDRFRLHPKIYYEKMLIQADKPIASRPDLAIKLFFAQHNKEIIAGGIFAFFGQTTAYLHGASSYGHRRLMAPHLLQWHLICLAKKLGYRYYDFYGIDEQKWPGVTRFKRGFGGQIVEYPGAFDFVFSPAWYQVYKLGRKIRRRCIS